MSFHTSHHLPFIASQETSNTFIDGEPVLEGLPIALGEDSFSNEPVFVASQMGNSCVMSPISGFLAEIVRIQKATAIGGSFVVIFEAIS